MPEKTENEEIKLKLYNSPELRAGQLYKLLVNQPIEVKKSLQQMIEQVPLTKKPERNYVSDEGSD